MRGFTVFLLIVLIGLGGFLYWMPDDFLSSCRHTLSYDIGRFDDDFGITREQFFEAIQQAEKMWEDATGYNHFEYKAGADFPINLVYSEQQQKSLEWKSTEQTLTSLQEEIKISDQQYKDLTEKYESQLTQYQDDLEEHNQKVQYWNTQGGAPSKEFAELKKTEQALGKQASALDKLRIQVNELATKNNELVNIYNANVDAQNKIFGDVEFDKGIYEQNEINIYQFDDPVDLINLIAHELGHAMGMHHVEGEKSIMYYLTTDENIHDRSITASDIDELEVVCGVQIW